MREFQEILAKISYARTGLMGIAMIFIVLYHMYVMVPASGNLLLFKDGFVGVDMFMLLSGFGLCHSYEKNTITIFYKHRFYRIFPLYCVWCLMTGIMALTLSQLSLNEFATSFALKLSLVSYFIPEYDDSWFVPAIAILYLLFPMFYKLGGGGGYYWR